MTNRFLWLHGFLAALPGAPADLCGFTPARRSWYYDRFLKHSGWYPDRLLRVFRRNGVHFTQSGAHEHIDPNGRTRELDGDILHYPYKHFREHLDKINSYAQQGADDLAARGKKGYTGFAIEPLRAAFLRVDFRTGLRADFCGGLRRPFCGTAISHPPLRKRRVVQSCMH